MSPLFDELAFAGEWRRYQRAAIAVFDRDRRAGRRRTHIVAPPGSGKTLLGVELVRRAGGRALVLAPNASVQLEWPRAVREFARDPAAAHRIAGPDPLQPIACLTYEGLTDVADPELIVNRLIQARWEAEATEGPPGEADLTRISAALRGELARGEDATLELAHLLSAPARRRVQQLRTMGVKTLLLDECHHLASLWGYVIRAVLAELGDDVHVVGLTATPPGSLASDDIEVYAALLGEADFTVPTPAVVRDGHLAPYQELAWPTEPAPAERAWFEQREARLRELVRIVRQEPPGPLSLRNWIERRTALQGAGARVLAALHGGPAAPAAVWLAVLDDYARGCLRAAASPEADARAEAVAGALADLRRGAADAERLLTRSQAKERGLVEIVAAESAARGEALRALVLCDSEHGPEQKPDDALAGVLEPGAGTARHALLALAEDSRTAPLRPLLVSQRGLRCVPRDAELLRQQLSECADGRFQLPEWAAEPDGVLVDLRSSGAEWMARAWVELATRLLIDGTTRLLVGTRDQLGEGWECRPLNVLVDLATAAAGAPVQQRRARALRLDSRDPGKVASNWDVVSAVPGSALGGGDYARFVRRQQELFAPAQDGAIELGPGHAHVELGPHAPPHDLAAIAADALARAADRDAARERWGIGSGYRGVELPSLLARATGAVLPLEEMARALGAALVALGACREETVASLEVRPHSAGFERLTLPAATPEEARLVTGALAAALAGGEPRLAFAPGRGGRRLGRVLGRRPRTEELACALPATFATDAARSDALLAAWRRHVGPARVVEDRTGPEPARYETFMRAVWV